jgi:RNA polymerase sigma-70 factor (ECF subfamily)
VWLNGRKAAILRETEPLDEQTDSGAIDGSAAMEAHMTLQEVRAAFARLPEDQQRALFLVSVEGYSYREAADLLEVPLGTVISRIARGRVALAQRRSDNADKIVVLRRNRS